MSEVNFVMKGWCDLQRSKLIQISHFNSKPHEFCFHQSLKPYLILKLIRFSKMNKEKSTKLTLDFAKRDGLLPVIVQDATTKEILMLGYANEYALNETIASGMATFWSTSRNELWTKGKTSGDYLKIEEIRTDCDQDALIYLVTPQGEGACHTKNSKGKTRKSCFYRKMSSRNELIFLEGEE